MPVQSSSKLQRPAAPGTPALIPLGEHAGKPAILLNRQITTVGSRHDARLHLLSRTVSKAHALIVVSNGGAYIRDLASRTKVYINGKAVREVVLNDGDLIKIGTFTFRFAGGGVGSARPDSAVATSAPAAHLEVDGADLPVPIADKVVLVGRRPTCDVALVEASVSTAHAAIVETGGRRILCDLGSRTGSFVNGKRVRQIELSFGDQIRIGETEMRYTPVELSLDEPAGSDVQEIESLLGDFEAPPAMPIEADEDENAAAAQHAAESPASAETADEAQQLLVDADLRQEKLSSSATHTELQAEADKAIESATRQEGVTDADVADLLAVDEALKGTASPEVEDLLPSAGADDAEPTEPAEQLRPRRGWRAKRGPELESEAAPPPPAAEPIVESRLPDDIVADDADAAATTQQEPEPQEAAVEPPPATPQAADEPPTQDEAVVAAETQAQDDEEERVFRIPNEDDFDAESTGAGGGTAVLDLADEASVADEQASSALADEQDLGLSPRLAELASAAPSAADDEASDAQEHPSPVEELANIDFSGLKFGADARESAEQAAEEQEQQAEPEPALAGDDHGQERAQEPPRPLIDLAPQPGERAVEEPSSPAEASEEAVPLIARDALPPAPVDEVPPSASTPTPPTVQTEAEDEVKPKRRPPRRKRKVDSTVVSSAAAPPPPTAPSESESAEVPLLAEGESSSEAPALPPVSDEAPTPIAFESEPSTESESAGLASGGDDDEVLEPTEPTLESALDLSGAEIEAELEAQSMAPPPAESELTDTTFSRAVDDFTGESTTGPLVEEPSAGADVDGGVAAAAAEEFEAPEPPPLVQEPEPLPVEQFTEAAPEEAPAAEEPPIEQEPVQEQPATAEEPQEAPRAPSSRPLPPSFGVDQAGFLGGSPLKLGNLAPPPRPRRSAPFGKKPLVAAEEFSEELPSATFARGPFDVTPDDVPSSRRQQEEIPPYTGETPTAGQITTGFDGLAMPPVREADVFSQMFPSAGAEARQAASHQGAPLDLVVPESNAKSTTGRKSPASALDVPAEDFWGSNEAPAHAAPEERGDPFDVNDGAAPSATTTTTTTTTAAPAAAEVRSARAPRTPARNRPPAIPQPAGVEAPPTLTPRRKKRWWSIRMLLALMLLSMIAAAAGIYFLVPVRTTIVGALKFSNFDELTEYDRLAIVRQQEDLLKNPDLRTLSQNLFKRNHPQADPGFLADPVSFGQTVAGGATWPNDGDMLAIRYVGSDPDAQADVQRVAALMSALYSKNSALVDVRNRVQAQVDGLQRAIAKTQGEVSRLESERDRLKPLFDARPSAAKLAEVQEQLDQRKKVWNAAVTAVTHLKVEVEALRRAAGVETPAATTQPTAAAAAAPTTLPSVAAQSAVAGEVDPQIAELQESLDDAATKLAAQKKADADKARQARQDLDAALEEFQQQIAAAKGSLENNPELQAYLDEAQSLQQAMRKLTIELIDRQQEQHTRLTELKQRLDEKLQERRSNAWQNDPQLREFGERLAMTRRAHNAALAEGLNDEAKDLEAKVKLLEEMIKSRQELVGQDTLVSDTIQQLEEMIASTEKQLADDRKSSEEMMDRLQKSFAQNQASKLPAEQQALAADLEKRIADMNAARAQYASALGDSTTGSVDARQLEAVVSDLRSKIEIRAAELERQQNEQAVSDGQQNARQGGLESRQAELAAAEESEAKAQAAYFEVHNEYQDLQASLAQARSAGEKLDETIHDLAVARDQLTRQQDQLQAKTSELARAAAPMAPGENDVRVSDRQDLRSTIILASWGGIAVLFVIMISLTSASSSSSSSASEVPLAAIAPSARDDNGEAGGHHEGDAEESAADNIIDDDDDRSPASSNGHANGDAPDEHHTESAEVARF